MDFQTDNQSWHATLDASGRLLLPAELREAINAEAGTNFVWTLSDQELKVQTLKQTVKLAQEYFLNLDDPKNVWSEELIANRRAEACNE